MLSLNQDYFRYNDGDHSVVERTAEHTGVRQMKRKYRIKKNKDFQVVFKKGNSFANRQFVLYILQKPEEKEFRIGLSVSKKIGNAVTRNKVKRLIRQVFSEEKHRISNGKEFIIIARKPAAEMNYHEVKGSLNHLFRKAKIYQSK